MKRIATQRKMKNANATLLSTQPFLHQSSGGTHAQVPQTPWGDPVPQGHQIPQRHHSSDDDDVDDQLARECNDVLLEA